MPFAAPRPCAAPGCHELVRGGPRCPKHTLQREAERRRDAAAYDKKRGSSRERGYDYAWTKHAKWFRQNREPLCRACKRDGKVTPAEMVDHIRPWQSGATEAERQRLKFDNDNLQSLCWKHHREKSAAHDGALGNPRRPM